MGARLAFVDDGRRSRRVTLRAYAWYRVSMAKRLALLAVITLALGGCEKTKAPEPAPLAASSAPPASAAPSARPTASAPTFPTVPAAPFPLTDAAKAVIDAADRAPDDRALDAGRHPAELLSFLGIRPGMKVADLAAGFGYTTELLARAVGPKGKVYGQNNKFVLEKFAEKGWSERVAKPVDKNVVRLDRELDDPFPADVKDLDAVVFVLFYHDTVWQKTDRAKMNKAIFAALKKGGVYAIVDHSGRPGTGATETETFHRIEEKTVRDEVEAAGFKLAGEANFLRNPTDTRDWNDSPRAAGDKRGTSDRFVLKFEKPLATLQGRDAGCPTREVIRSSCLGGSASAPRANAAMACVRERVRLSGGHESSSHSHANRRLFPHDARRMQQLLGWRLQRGCGRRER